MVVSVLGYAAAEEPASVLPTIRYRLTHAQHHALSFVSMRPLLSMCAHVHAW